MALTLAQRIVNEDSTFVYTTTLQDTSSAALASASIVTLTLTVYDETSGEDIVAVRDALNANSVTVHATSGLLTWTALAADNPIHNDPGPGPGEIEKHIGLFEMVYDTDKTLNWEVPIYVKQMTNV